MSAITELFTDTRNGKAEAMPKLFALLYQELRGIAGVRAKLGNATLTPTELVSEAFLKLNASTEIALNDRPHFFAVVANAMRQVLFDRARARLAQKRDGGVAIGLDSPLLDGRTSLVDEDRLSAETMALEQAMVELEQVNPRQYQIVSLHYFAGVAFAEIATMLDTSERTLFRDWQRAKAFLQVRMQDAELQL